MLRLKRRKRLPSKGEHSLTLQNKQRQINLILLGAGLLVLLLTLLICITTNPVLLADSGVVPPKTAFWERQLHLAKEEITVNPTSQDGYFQLAVAQAMLGLIEGSFDSFETLDKLDTGHSFAGSIIARYAQQERSRDDLLVQSYLAFAYYWQKQYANSVEVFEQVVHLDPSNPWPRNYLGFAYYKAGYLPKAINILESSVAIDPTNQYSHALLGLAYYEAGHFFKALQELTKGAGALRQFWR